MSRPIDKMKLKAHSKSLDKLCNVNGDAIKSIVNNNN